MADELQKRIGRDTEKGREWPALDLLGRTYHRPPAGTIGLGNGHFAVLPGGVKPAQYASALDQVKSFLAGKSRARAVSLPKGEAPKAQDKENEK
jgi:hypothetical protein